METVLAKLDIEVFVDCPSCDSMLNLLDPADTSEQDHKDDGNILSQAFPSGQKVLCRSQNCN